MTKSFANPTKGRVVSDQEISMHFRQVSWSINCALQHKFTLKAARLSSFFESLQQQVHRGYWSIGKIILCASAHDSLSNVLASLPRSRKIKQHPMRGASRGESDWTTVRL